MRKRNIIYIAAVLLLAVTGCIKNDLPYPRIILNITSLVAEGELRPSYIDSVSQEVTVYLKENVDIDHVHFSEFTMSPGARCDTNLLQGPYNLTQPLYVKLSLYQDYVWKIQAVQDIERYFEVDGEVGSSVIDPVAHRVVVTMPEGTNLHKLQLVRAKLGPAGVTDYDPPLVAGPIDLYEPKKVTLRYWDREEVWTIYAQVSELIVSTSRVDAWSQVVWAYGTGPADVKNGFQYRKTGDTEWTEVPEANVTQTQGSFACHIDHLEPLTEYDVRAVSGENAGNIVSVTTQATADIPNGDFENWHKTAKGMWCPWAEDGISFWDTGNTGTMTLGTNNSEPSDHTPTGSGTAALLNTRFVGIGVIGKLGAGSIFTGQFAKVDGTNGILNFGRPWNLRPTKLKGYYQYQGVDIDYVSSELADLKGRPDTCQIYVALTDWTAPYEIRTNPKNRQLFNPNADYVIGYGELLQAGTMDGYQPFEVEIKYRDTSRVPGYLVITCCASKYGDYFTGGNGSKLWVDQLSFSYDY